MGLASPQEVEPLMDSLGRKTAPRKIWSWSAVKRWFVADPAPDQQPCAVCIPPGATLILRDIPRSLQSEFGVGVIEEVTFVQTTAVANTYRDALRFVNQRQILLQALRPGQRLSVVTLELTINETTAEWLTA